MLEPTDRRHLLESLRPPEGYVLTHAIGTTYSMDLLSLLTVPLAFSLFDWETQDGSLAQDPLAVLEALRRHAEHMLIFCQTGAIHVPKDVPLLVASLEGSVIEVKSARAQGVFHPKIWLLRFVSANGPVLYRFLCASRNITFDRSWDTVLVLDGELEEREKGFGVNRPLADFVKALPGLACHEIAQAGLDLVDTMHREVRKVRFTPPSGFDEVKFWPLGIEGYRRRPFPENMRQLMVVSPFVSADLLRRLSDSAENARLVSRVEALQELDRNQLEGYSHVFTMASEADPEPESEEHTDHLPEAPPSGLHAKLYIADLGWDSRVWTGSANATTAAFSDNVEFLAELTGRRSICGVDAALTKTPGRMGFGDLIQEYEPDMDAMPPDPVLRALEDKIREAKRLLVDAGMRAQVLAEGEENTYTVVLHAGRDAVGPIALPGKDVEMYCWPITLPEENAAIVERLTGQVARFGHVSFPGLTAFFAFRIEATHSGQKRDSRFVLNLPLEGAPEDRRERLLRYLLKDRNQVLRLLLLILADLEADPVSEAMLRRLLLSTPSEFGYFPSAALLETLLRALVRNPERLDQAARLVTDLESTPEGRALLPEGFRAVWDPIWSAREALKV
jgi:hypothetical protein